MSIYVRIKRKKTTYFIQTSPSETILEIKQKLEEYCTVRPEEQQILKQRSGGWKNLEDSIKVEDAQIENDEVLALCLLGQDGAFESVEITPYQVEMG
eukprot:g2427.t1